MFTVEQRDALCRRVLGLGEQDERVVAGAVVGSLAFDEGDRFSDVDLTFGVADHVEVAAVLGDWTRTLVDEFDAVPLVDLERGPITYRVFLLPDALQLDLSMSPAAGFRPAGPRFRLVFGETAADGPEASAPPVVGDLFIATPSIPEDVFGWGVIYACMRARASNAGACGRRSTTSVPSAITLSPSPASAKGWGRRRRAATTISPRSPWLDSTEPTSVRSNLGRSGQRSPPPSSRSCTRVRKYASRTPAWSPNASRTSRSTRRRCLHRTDAFAATRPSMWEHGAPSLLALDPGSRSLAETTKRKPRSLALVVLAAGKGKRMRSATPKVLHPIAGRAALWHVVQAGLAAKPTKIVVVVGHDAPQVEAEVRSWGLTPKPVFVVQRPQRGTAHAVEVAKSAVGRATDVLVANGDFDPVSQDDVRALLRSHRRTGAAATLLTTELDDPGTYGRVIRDSRGRFVEIDEDRDTPGADAIREVGTNWIAFARGPLFATLPLVDAKTKQRERYLNRVYPLLRERGERVDAVRADTGGVMGVNSRTGLAGLEALMRDRINAAHMANGVTIIDPATTYIDIDVSIGSDTVDPPHDVPRRGHLDRLGLRDRPVRSPDRHRGGGPVPGELRGGEPRGAG